MSTKRVRAARAVAKVRTAPDRDWVGTGAVPIGSRVSEYDHLDRRTVDAAREDLRGLEYRATATPGAFELIDVLQDLCLTLEDFKGDTDNYTEHVGRCVIAATAAVKRILRVGV